MRRSSTKGTGPPVFARQPANSWWDRYDLKTESFLKNMKPIFYFPFGSWSDRGLPSNYPELSMTFDTRFQNSALDMKSSSSSSLDNMQSECYVQAWCDCPFATFLKQKIPHFTVAVTMRCTIMQVCDFSSSLNYSVHQHSCVTRAFFWHESRDL